ncbi:hypothetical protein F4802DRAFT_550296 [Xylaria palmicola]|nr:hypothetical protein F4802DRAFT_550296 [Xylaria palmicola]
MPKRQRAETANKEDLRKESLPTSSIQSDLGLLRLPDLPGPQVLVAGMVGGDDSDIPKGMPKSRGINFLVGKRLVAPGSGTYSYPCGRLQSGEPILACASRIVREQTSLKVEAEATIRTTENVIEGEHFITFFVFCGFPDGEDQLKKDNHTEGEDWHWSTLIEEDAIAVSRGEKPGKPVFAPPVNLWDSHITRDIDWDREPGIRI